MITGSNGLLGQKIIYSLLRSGHSGIIACSKGENRILEKRGYKYSPLDISDRTAVQYLLNREMPDVVINTAAMTNVDACETKRNECDAVNVTGVQNLVEELEKLQSSFAVYKPHLIHLSTDFVFNGEAGPYREEDEPDPLSYYALSKWKAEEILKASRLKWSIARTIIIYGIVDNMSRSNVVLWAKDALSKGQKINVVDDQFRSPTLAEDLAEGCLMIANKGAQGIFHLSGPETMSIKELVEKVAGFWHLDGSLINPIKSSSLNQAAKRPPRTGFILDKAKRILNYHPHSFLEGLKVLEDQFKKHLN